MKLNKPLLHVRLDQLGFFYWDPRIDPREPEYDPHFDPEAEVSQDPKEGLFLCYNISIQTKRIDAATSPPE